jgi:hypothetical protein
MTGLGFGLYHTVAAELHREAFKRPYGNRFIHLTAPAVIFAGVGTDVSANRGKRISAPDYLEGFHHFPLSDQVYIFPDIHMKRAFCLAWRCETVIKAFIGAINGMILPEVVLRHPFPPS